MKYKTVILYCRDGYEIERAEDIEGMRRAKEHARHFLSEQFALLSETSHERLRTHKVAIFGEGEATGANCICDWDEEHPQHKRWLALQPAE